MLQKTPIFKFFYLLLPLFLNNNKWLYFCFIFQTKQVVKFSKLYSSICEQNFGIDFEIYFNYFFSIPAGKSCLSAEQCMTFPLSPTIISFITPPPSPSMVCRHLWLNSYSPFPYLQQPSASAIYHSNIYQRHKLLSPSQILPCIENTDGIFSHSVYACMYGTA